ncbi:MAG: T9SS type A sorting domain-containing protein [Bacteroidales bacterium]|nr:T9SS type A sorting domain-containing protein [Bacteroidales bacterium]
MKKAILNTIGTPIFFLFASFFSPLVLNGQGLPPGWEHTNTANFHVISVPVSSFPSINGIPISPGDYIGVFFMDNDTMKCGGASEWLGDQNIAVVAFGDDNLTTEKDGFTYGESINWKIFSWDIVEEFDAIATYDSTLPNYDGTFVINGLSALSALNAISGLYVIANSMPATVCIGSSSQLTAEPGGGGVSNYSYTWGSIPEGFYSNEQNPVVSPPDTTLYIVTVSDGDTTATDTTTVNIIFLPEVFSGFDTALCENNNLQLNAIASNFDSVFWVTEGDGTFENDTLLNTLYFPGSEDIESGTVKLTLTAGSISPCQGLVSDNLFLFFHYLPMVDAGPDDTICAGENHIALGYTINASYIFWSTSGDGIFDDSTSSSAVYTPGTEDIATGIAFLTLTAEPIQPCDSIITDFMALIINPLPMPDAGDDVTIPYGTNTQLIGSVTGGSGTFSYLWEPEEMLIDPTIPDPLTINLTSTTVFSFTVLDESSACQNTDDVVVFVSGGPLSVIARADPEEICTGYSSQLMAIPSGGSGEYSYEWTSNPPGFSSLLQDPIVYPEFTTTYYVEVNDGFTIRSDSVVVLVNLIPEADAGEDDSILYGTNTTLHGSATGGSGWFDYFWQPAVYLVNPHVQHPSTVNLTQTVSFALVVTDIVSGCSGSDAVTIFVTGSPLQVDVSADPDRICQNATAQLNAQPGGGSLEYTYQWTSEPEGFYSEITNPVVSPLETTDYFVLVFDGYNEVTGSVNVQVDPLPDVTIVAFPNDTVCINEFITLDATTPGAIDYYWPHGGQTTPAITFDTTGLGLGTHVISVVVTDYNDCSSTDSLNITFDICSGYNILDPGKSVIIFPNPANGHVAISTCGLDALRITLFNLYGQTVFEKETDVNIPHQTYHLPVNGVKEGLYFLQIESGVWRVVEKLVIRH